LCFALQVTLIDQSDRFVFKPLLYELLNGTALPEEVAPTFAQLLAPYPVQFIQVSRRVFYS
jgi:NADH dehydrogenase FAD-containing subunit